jgi:predicted DCC family thiol-disulfide oxidoreductase YuxK
VNTVITGNVVTIPRGWVFFDAECDFCVRGATRWGGWFERRGFRWLPLQTPGTAKRLGVAETALREEMHLLLADGQLAHGVEAWVILFRAVWWLWPLGFLLRRPGIHWLGDCTYRWVARNRNCFAGRCENRRPKPSRHRHGAFFELP